MIITVIPNAAIASSQMIEVTGTDNYDRKWYVQEVVTTFNNNGNPSQVIQLISDKSFDNAQFSRKESNKSQSSNTVADKELQQKIQEHNATKGKIRMEAILVV